MCQTAKHYPESNSQNLQLPQSDFSSQFVKLLEKPEFDFFKYIERLKEKRLPKDHIYCCTKGYRYGYTSKYNVYAAMVCGREWCQDCQTMESITHRRRMLRWSSKVLYMLKHYSVVGYTVITIPKYIRHYFKSKDALNDFRTYIRRKLKNHGVKHGLIRFHWCGEDGKEWHPHLNILWPKGWWKEKDMDLFKHDLSIWFKNYCNLKYRPVMNVWHNYTSNLKKVNFWNRYVNRATLLNPTKELMEVVNRFKNNSVLGKFPKLTGEESIEKQIDRGFIDGEKIVWPNRIDEKGRKRPIIANYEQMSLSCKKLNGLSSGYFYGEKEEPADGVAIQKMNDLIYDFKNQIKRFEVIALNYAKILDCGLDSRFVPPESLSWPFVFSCKRYQFELPNGWLDPQNECPF
jgi:hypothetical protein